MIKRDCLWLWGQDAGVHHEVEEFNLPGTNNMGVAEGAEFFGIRNVCRVAMNNKPEPPFDNEMEKLSGCERVVWSLIGDKGSDRTDSGQSDIDEVLRLAEKYHCITGGVMDDFFSEERKKVYTPDVIAGFSQRLKEKNLDLWCVIYEHQLDDDVSEWLKSCDVVSMWTWMGENLKSLEENLKKLEKQVGKNQKIYAGCYMWDYGNGCEMPLELMEYQLNIYKKWLEDRKIDGIILCSNCIADIGLEAVSFTKRWIEENTGD